MTTLSPSTPRGSGLRGETHLFPTANSTSIGAKVKSAVLMKDTAVEELFTPTTLGGVELPNRLVMAPLTRLRAGDEGVPGDLLVEHYRQRASLGLIITEGTWPVMEGRTWIGQPGIETARQQAGWARVTEAVHAAGGRIAMQIMHGGRVSHPTLTRTGRIVAPSATAAPQPIRIPGGKAAPPVAHALETAEIPVLIAQFVAAARRAIDAGMDAVELHGANGYLIHQFFSPAANHRQDAYGGTPAKRARFAIEAVHAVAEAIGAERTGIRISPGHEFQGMAENDPEQTHETYAIFADAIAPLKLAFVDMLHENPGSHLVQDIRRRSGTALIANTGFTVSTTKEEAAWIISEGHAEAAGVGRPVIANPDLAARWQHGYPENTADPATFYSHDASGYTDYPALV